MQLTARRANRLEVWTAPQCAGGVRVAMLPQAIACDATSQLPGLGSDELALTVPINDTNAAELFAQRVVRVWEDDTRFDEWRIAQPERTPDEGLLKIAGAGVETFLAVRTSPISQVTGGLCFYNIDIVGLKPSEIIDQWVLPALAADGIAWLARGTIDQDVAIDVTLDWESPLALLRKIADLLKLEIQFRRNGTTSYFVDLLTTIGAAAATVDLRYSKNLQSLALRHAADEQANRVFPRGADEDGVRATMSRAAWKVNTVVGSVITLVDPLGGDGPLAFDNQLNGFYFRKNDGTLTLISASSAGAQSVTVASAAGVSVGDLIQFRRNANGDDLTFLDYPTEQATSGVVTGWPEYSDIPSTNNVLPNPAGRTWPAGVLPTGWTAIGAPTTSKNVTAPFFRTAPYSLKVIANSGEGVQSPAGKVFPTSLKPYVSGFASVWIASGQVRVELVVTAPGGPFIRPIAPAVASSEFTGQWEDLGVSGEDLAALAATAVAIRVVANGGAATFYVDRAQGTEGAAQLPFFEGSGGTRLWQLGNEQLRLRGAPLPIFTIGMADLARAFPAIYTLDAVPELGAGVNVTDARVLNATSGSRITSVRMNYLRPAETQLTVSNQPEDLTGQLARPTRAPRLSPIVSEPNEELGPTLDVNTTPGSTAFTVNYVVFADTFDYSTDGGAFTAVPATGFSVSRPAAGANDRTLTFRAKKNDQTVTNTVTIPAIDRDTVTPDLTVTQTAQNDTTSSFQATASNPQGGAAPTITVFFVNCTSSTGHTNGQTIASGTTVGVNRPTMGSAQATVRFRAAITSAGAEEESRTIPPKMKDPATDPENMIVNGGGQDGGEPGTNPTGWTYGAGSGLNVDISTSKFGDRSMSIVNGSSIDSYTYQGFSLVDGAFYELSGWIAATAAASISPVLEISHQVGAGRVIVYDHVGAKFDTDLLGAFNIGPGTGTYDFSFVRVLFKVTTSGAVNLYLRFGGDVFAATPTTGTAWFDGLKLRRVTRPGPNLLVWAAEGTTADTIYYTVDADATLVYRTDNGSDSTPAASGFTVSRNATGGAKKVLTFTATRAGIIETRNIEVQPQVNTASACTAVVTRLYKSSENYATDEITFTWEYDGTLGGGTFDIDFIATAGNLGDHTQSSSRTNASSGASPASFVKSVAEDITNGLGVSSETYSVRIVVKDSSGTVVRLSDWFDVTYRIN